MSYKQQIENIEDEIFMLENTLDELRKKQEEYENKTVFYIIEEGIDSFGDHYLICEEVPDWYDMDDIDHDIEVEREHSMANEYKLVSFRLSTKREEDYGL
ncbi:hypothetical protein P4H82_27915 [Bacillus cereus]|nr:hypothetical protein [Bacillus cereus]MEB9190653.1 hypothetical protein [Bacillus cereus]